MRTATGNFGDDQRAVLFARLPEQLDDERRRRKYDEPLAAAIRDAGVGDSLRGFSQAGDDGQIAWVGIEVTLEVMQNGTFVAERLAALGAPPETRIEIETASATLEFTLAEATGR
jgi:hypothetical protein